MRHHAFRSSVVALGALVLTATPLFAQTAPEADLVPELVTDRPDFTESSFAIAKGWFQLESGLSFEGDGPDARAFTAPAALVRIGLGFNTELRLAGDGLVSQSFAGSRTSGFSDVEIGAKTQLLFHDRAGFDLAVLPAVSLPTGADGFSSESVDPSVKITWGRDLPGGIGMTGNFNFASLTDDLGRFRQEAVSLSFGRGLTANWSAYAEAYAFSRLGRGEDAAMTLNGGFTRAVGSNIQLDIEAGRGVTSSAPDWFVAAGFALRGPIGRRR